MKRLIYGIVITLVSYFSAFTQTYDKVVVLGVNYLNRNIFYEEHFNDYFKDTEYTFLNKVIEKAFQEKFGIDSIVYHQNKISYKYGILKDKLTTTNEMFQYGNSVLYISFETIASLRFSSENQQKVKLTTTVIAYEPNGEVKWKQKCIVPIEISEPEYIAEPILLSKSDFLEAFSRSFQYAILKENEKLEEMKFLRPRTNFYDDFLVNANKYYFSENRKYLSFERDQKTLFSLRRKIIPFKSFDSGFNAKLISKDKVRNSFSLTNEKTGEQNFVLVHVGGIELFDFISSNDDAVVNILSKSDTIANFALESNGYLKGKYNNKLFEYSYVPDFDVFEFFIDTQIMALVKVHNGRYVCYVSNSLKPDSYKVLVHTIFSYQEAVNAKIELEERQAEDD
jgi:hypothetical protein